ncbi:MAG: tetratricopeptide repeat protein, partial [Acidobacteriota bacterium]
SCGSDHSTVAIDPNNLASSLAKKRKAEEAFPFAERAVRIFEAALPESHPHVEGSRLRLAQIRVRIAEAEDKGEG